MTKESSELILVGHDTFTKIRKRTREESGMNLEPKALRDFFSKETGEAFVTDRYIDMFQGRAPRNVLVKHYAP
jgi:intergrase/recombinase